MNRGSQLKSYSICCTVLKDMMGGNHMQKQCKKIAAGILSAAMLVPTGVSIAEPVRASALQAVILRAFSRKSSHIWDSPKPK